MNPTFLKNRLDYFRAQISRDVTFYTPSSYNDYLASGYYNPITTSTASTLTETVIPARVHWAGNERITATPGGKYFIGDCTLGIDPIYHDLAQQTQKEAGKILVDGQEVQILRIDPEGAPEINRYKLICKTMGARPTD